MSKLIVPLFSILLLSFSVNLYGQNVSRNITGIVTIEGSREALEGVTVKVKGTSNVSGTQPDGIFYITVKSNDSILVFSAEGFLTREVLITHETEYEVTLQRASDLTSMKSPNKTSKFDF